jgi:hypothetical protein
MADERAATLRMVYQEICKTHNAIADFRAKLLALLPIASGAGVFFLLEKLNGGERWLLIPVGVFGAAVTLGLLMYELRGIEDCTVLRKRGWELEKALMVRWEASQFAGWTKAGKRNLADEIGAAWIIYTTVIAGWIFVAAAGLSSLSKHGWPWWGKLVFGLGLAILYLGVLVWALRGWRESGGHDSWGRRSKRVQIWPCSEGPAEASPSPPR